MCEENSDCHTKATRLAGSCLVASQCREPDVITKDVTMTLSTSLAESCTPSGLDGVYARMRKGDRLLRTLSECYHLEERLLQIKS